MKIELSEPARRYIEAQLAAGRYRTPVELVAELLRQQEERERSEQRLWERQRRALRSLLGDWPARPAALPDDGLSNRDHDRILYGGEA
jgi:Arc/MetJ-type ribon-helix-helix transcriptional regulator